MKLRFKAPAKINLTLEVLKRLPNGFHELRSVSCKLKYLCDELIIETTGNGNKIEVQSRGMEVPQGKENICFAAAERYFSEIKERIGLKICIQKRIPAAAGLGGGSSDAAAVLFALNKIFKNRLAERKLVGIGAEIGTEIPSFLFPDQIIYKTGMGEVVKPVAANINCHFVIVNPAINISTKEAYGLLSKQTLIKNVKERSDKSRAMLSAILKKEKESIAVNLYNDFELIQETAYPVIKEIKQFLLAFGAEGSLMSGSGSTVFGIFFSRKRAEAAGKEIKNFFPTFMVHCE